MVAETKTAVAGSVVFGSLATIAIAFAFLSPRSIVSVVPQKAEAVGPTVIFLTSGTSWTVPNDWDSANNTIEVIGGGGGGGAGMGPSSVGSGGGGGAYSKVSNVALTPGAGVSYRVGTGGSIQNGNGFPGGDTWFGAGTCAGSTVCAKGGGGGIVGGIGAAGGAAASGIGTVKYSGGAGRDSQSGTYGGGGGGAAGPNGNGGVGTGSVCTSGAGDAGFGGAASACRLSDPPVAGNAGTEFDSTHGSGGGGGGAAGGDVQGGGGGLYGGGGGGSRKQLAIDFMGGPGAQGLIVITYTPVPPTTVPTAPQNLDAAGGTNQISLTWQAPSSDGGSAITNYKIYRSTSPTPTTLYQTVGNVLSYTDTGVVTGTIYYYRVKATNAVGDSAYSNEDSAVATATCSPGSNGGNITGWGWSDTIGWVSLNSGDSGTCAGSTVYGLTLSGSTITGYAWSENVGWIQFGGLSGFPSGSGTTASNATVSGNSVVGWARALSYGDSQSGGWDGWISLSGTGYGLNIVNGAQITGYAWGDTNLGWIDFGANYACSQTYGYYCSGNVRHYQDLACNVDGVAGVPETCSYLCSSGACVPPPNPTGTLGGGVAIKVTPTLVRKGATVTVQWGTQDTQSCTVTGTNGNSWTGTSGTQTSSAIQTTTTFTLDCTGGGGTSLHQTAQVRTTPRFKEF